MTECDHDVWLVPDMAMFQGMKDRMFTIRCAKCGHQKQIRGIDAEQAEERQRFEFERVRCIECGRWFYGLEDEMCALCWSELEIW